MDWVSIVVGFIQMVGGIVLGFYVADRWFLRREIDIAIKHLKNSPEIQKMKAEFMSSFNKIADGFQNAMVKGMTIKTPLGTIEIGGGDGEDENGRT